MNCGAHAAASAARTRLRDLRGTLRMPFSHFRGGLKSPTHQSRSGDGAPPLPCGGGFTMSGFTLNGFSVNRFFPPVDGLLHGRSRKPFRICSCEKCARNSSAFCTYKSLDLKSPGINTYKNRGGGGLGACPSKPSKPAFVILSRSGWRGISPDWLVSCGPAVVDFFCRVASNSRCCRS